MPVYSEILRKARKDRRCDDCGKWIEKGQTYSRLFGCAEVGDRPYALHVCQSCYVPMAERTTPETDGYGYIRRQYGVPVRVGQRVMVNGHMGTVKPADPGNGHYLHVHMDGQKRPEVNHPTWETVYYAEDGVTILADYRKKKEATSA